MSRPRLRPGAGGRSLVARLRRLALSYPEAAEEFPWGERVVKVRGKIFVFLGVHDGSLHVTVKLPASGSAALELPFCKPTGYGLGKSGWISAAFPDRGGAPEAVLAEWIDESYRAVAPRTLVKALDSEQAPAPRRPR